MFSDIMYTKHVNKPIKCLITSIINNESKANYCEN